VTALPVRERLGRHLVPSHKRFRWRQSVESRWRDHVAAQRRLLCDGLSPGYWSIVVDVPCELPLALQQRAATPGQLIEISPTTFGSKCDLTSRCILDRIEC